MARVCKVPYEVIEIFHDGANCILHKFYTKRIDGTPGFKYANFPCNDAGIPTHGLPVGTTAVMETVRSALAVKIGSKEASALTDVELLENLEFYGYVLPEVSTRKKIFVDEKSDDNIFRPSNITLEEMQLVPNFFHYVAHKSGSDDQVLKDIINMQLKNITKNSDYTEAAARKRVLFVLVTSDGDFSREIKKIHKAGVDFVLVHNPDNVKSALLPLCGGSHTGSWLEIVEMAQQARVNLKSTERNRTSAAASAATSAAKEVVRGSEDGVKIAGPTANDAAGNQRLVMVRTCTPAAAGASDLRNFGQSSQGTLI